MALNTLLQWPTDEDLRAWALFDRLEERSNFETPDEIKDWLRNLAGTDRATLHKALYNGYREFRERFRGPEDFEAWVHDRQPPAVTGG